MRLPDLLTARAFPPRLSLPHVPLRLERAPECKAEHKPEHKPQSKVPGAISKIADDCAQADVVDPRAQARCRIVLSVVEELVMLVGDRQALRRDRRRMMTHVRQIAMYVSHVVLQTSLTDIGIVFARDRTTVRYACHVVEDRRDDTDFDAFITSVERVVASAFGLGGEAHG